MKLLLLAWALGASAAFAQDSRPNVVVILVDDAGYMDFGGYGGEARTSNIDALGDAGIRFSNYHTSPLCAPSRAMLLTGLSNHRAGVATIPEVITEAQYGQPGYSLRFEEGVETVATKLQRAGYRTYMTGKWHLGHGPGDLPVDHGFDRSFILDASGADNYEQKSYMPYYEDAPWFEDGERAELPADFYSSDFIVDKMLEYLGEGEGPFFSYLAFQAIHIPLQAPTEVIRRYEGEYEDGWHALRESRWQKAREIGLIHPEAELAPMHENLDDFDALTEDERRYYVKSMQVNAAMLDAMDQAIGRLIARLKASGEFDNTLFIVTSDNGPEFNEPAMTPVFRFWMSQNGYTSETETLGEKGTIAHIGPEWASAASSPGSLFKFFSTEGGLRVPLIVSGAGVQSRPGFDPSSVFVTDIAPTVLEAAGVAAGDVDGVSLLPALSGAGRVDSARGVGIEVSGNAAFFRGDYKLARVTLPYGDERWRLFNIRLDPGETTDISAELPEIFESMKTGYDEYASAVGVIAMPEGFNPIQQVLANTVRRQIGFYGEYIAGAIVIFVLTIALLIAVMIRFRRRRAGQLKPG